MLFAHLPIFQHLYSLTKDLLIIIQHYNKGYRYTLGEKINSTGLILLTYLCEANSGVGSKIDHVMKMRSYHEQLTVVIRLSHDLKQISQSDYLVLIPQLDAIGRQLTSRHQKLSPSKPTF